MDETEVKRQRLCIEILQNCRNQLYHYFPYLDGAFASVGYRCADNIKGISTDGENFQAECGYLMNLYRRDSARVVRGYLHMLLHCLYLHIFPEKEVKPELWNLACDIAVELVIEGEKIQELALPEDGTRNRFIYSFGGKKCSAQQIYQMLEREELHESHQQLEKWFAFDRHQDWYESHTGERRAKTKQKWEKILAYTGQNRHDQKRKRGSREGKKEEYLQPTARSRYDYKKFLKRFTFPREEVEMDLESFDYIFYHFGMEEYGDMPLIEPLEYKEVNRMEELVIAIDTSGSCSSEIVQQFLAETYSILSDRENFFRKMKVYIIQCDCCIQDVVVIHSEEEWKNYSKNIRIQGRGGTDFRPVFAYVQEQRQKKELKDLKALIYFTDGDGIYPRSAPDYQTAFVFLEQTQKMELVPGWAVKLLV